MSQLLQSVTLLIVLLNPFLVIIYLVDVVEKLESTAFARVIIRASMIAAMVFICFAVVGDAIFSRIFQTEFASFQIFGGLIFAVIGLQFVFRGPTAIELLRGESDQLAGAIAMPVLVGPGTISASVLVGERHDPLTASSAVLISVLACAGVMILLKWAHDYVRPRNARLIEQYVAVAGRIAALYIGTVSIEMIVTGVQAWIEKF